ncbi:hypothetical protein [uncultured Nostoc sp.]|uniref:hypothetical protein n=1 Tax=uncultured Nostoc sp. TaxID=340711 RepID=UPI0035CB45A5
MATIKISELHPTSQFEKLSDADLQAVNGGQSAAQITTGATALVTGVNVGGGRIQNGTQSFNTFQGSIESPNFSASAFAGGFSQSFPS